MQVISPTSGINKICIFTSVRLLFNNYVSDTGASLYRLYINYWSTLFKVVKTENFKNVELPSYHEWFLVLVLTSIHDHPVYYSKEISKLKGK